MARDENPPFGLGETFFQGNTPTTTDGNHILGKVWVFEDIDLTASGSGGTMKPKRTNHARRMMAVRNTTGSALLPKRLGKIKNDGTSYEFGQEIDGYADAVTEIGYPIDEFLPAAGVADDDICWVCVGGPATVTTDASGDTNISIGAAVIPATNGTVVDQVVAEDDADIFTQLSSSPGRAMKAVNAISTDFVIFVAPRLF